MVAMIAPPTMRRGGRVNPFTQSAQYDSLLPEVGDGAGDFGDRATEAVDRDNDDGVAGAGVVEYRRQPGPRPGLEERQGCARVAVHRRPHQRGPAVVRPSALRN